MASVSQEMAAPTTFVHLVFGPVGGPSADFLMDGTFTWVPANASTASALQAAAVPCPVAFVVATDLYFLLALTATIPSHRHTSGCNTTREVSQFDEAILLNLALLHKSHSLGQWLPTFSHLRTTFQLHISYRLPVVQFIGYIHTG